VTAPHAPPLALVGRLLALAREHGADGVAFAADRPPALSSGHTARVVKLPPLRAGEVRELAARLAREARVPFGVSVAFDHAVDGVPVRVEYGEAGGGVRLSLRLVPAGVAPPAPAAPDDPATDGQSPGAEPERGGPSAPAEAGAGVREGIHGLLAMMLARGASDLHLRVGEPPLLRVDGRLERVQSWPALVGTQVAGMMARIAPEKNWQEYETRHDTDFAYEWEGRARFRVNLFRDRRGPGAVLRAIPGRVPTADELGLPDAVRRLCELPKGLVLVTGPTGSGKSTTLAALVDLVNRTRHDHVITLEDPIEFVHENVNCVITQREVGVHTASFKAGLRAALREDPDVVLVGEMRDLETIAFAVETAETGHLVFGTLHTTTAASTVSRMVDQFPAEQQEQIRVMLADSLRAVISQVLVRRRGGGRVAAREILIVTPAVSNLIREGKPYQIPSVMQTSRALGMVTLNDALLELVVRGDVEPAEAYAKAVDKAAFAKMLEQRGHAVAAGASA
jgi:twitching motility protein PilT